MSQSEVNVGEFPKNAAHRVGDILCFQFGGSHLVKESRKSVVVIPIDDQGMERFLCQAPGSPETAESGADNDHLWPCALIQLITMNSLSQIDLVGPIALQLTRFFR